MSTAESRGLVEEQAALRRLATLVASGAPSEEVFLAATEARLVDFTALIAMAIANAQSRVEVSASRARSVWSTR